ncbi:hypothetical protein CFC21_097191, partial [Triticum aestivum]
TEKHLKKTRTC